MLQRQPQLFNNTTLFYEGGFEIDDDGDPMAYHPKNIGNDYLKNAGSQGDWYGILTNSHGYPIIQGPNDPAPGYYISPTALVNHSKNITDPTRYVNAQKINYISVAHNLIKRYGIQMGDLALVYYKKTNILASALVADCGPNQKYGEGSVALANILGIPSNPKNGGCDTNVITIIFLNSKVNFPIDDTIIIQKTTDLITAIGGIDKFI